MREYNEISNLQILRVSSVHLRLKKAAPKGAAKGQKMIIHTQQLSLGGV